MNLTPPPRFDVRAPRRRAVLALFVGLAAGVAAADAPPDAAPDAGAATPTDAPALAEAPNALLPLEEKVGFLQGKLEALEAEHAESKSDLSALKKLKLSGYVQGRYSYVDTKIPESRFLVRRSRLKASYQGKWVGAVLQADLTGDGVSLKDAEISFSEPWTGKQLLTLVAGQTKTPFGYEVAQSSSDREFPERTRVVRAFINGERDRGAKLVFRHGFVRATAGLFDGNGIANTGFIGKDNDTTKDWIGRVGVDFKTVALGVSGWWGATTRPGAAATATTAAVARQRFERSRVGLDAQAYLDVLPIGGTAIKAELISGTTYQEKGVEVFGRTGLGWYVLLVQNVYKNDQVALRFEAFDPATGTPTKVDAKDPTKPASTNPIRTVGFLATHYLDPAVKLTASYEVPLVATTGTTDVAPTQNVLTLQLQAKY